jgi:hypothetical protein
MSLARKGARKITVDGEEYRWKVSVDSGYFVGRVCKPEGGNAVIEIIEWHEAVRRRPNMYIGDTCLLGLLFAIRGLLDVPRDPLSLRLTMTAARIRLDAECVPLSVEPRKRGYPPFFIEACSRLELPIDDPPTIGEVESIRRADCPLKIVPIGKTPEELPVLNALASSFEIASRTTVVETYATFARGVLESGPLQRPPMRPPGITIEFTPDATIFGDIQVNLEHVVHLARDFAGRKGVAMVIDEDGLECQL